MRSRSPGKEQETNPGKVQELMENQQPPTDSAMRESENQGNPSMIDSFLNRIDATMTSKYTLDHRINDIINKKEKDNSPQAKRGRMRMAMKAIVGEFFCCLMFYTPVFGCIVNLNYQGGSSLSTEALAFVQGLQAIAVCFAFSGISGAHFNSAVSFALWLTGKLSNRKVILYILVQMLASILSMGIVCSMFKYDNVEMARVCTVTPASGGDNLNFVFASEFFMTFILVFTAFTVVFEDAEDQKKQNMSFQTIGDSRGLTLYASTPQSKSGFAPFSIGFTVFSLCLINGESGGAFNPSRMFGPAIISGTWDYLWLYWIAQFLGAAMAGLLVHNVHRFGIDLKSSTNDVSAEEAARNVQRTRARGNSTDVAGNNESTTFNVLK